MNSRNHSLRVGVVGCGSFGCNAYARRIADHPETTLAALCDTDRSRAEACARACATNEITGEPNTGPPPSIYTGYRQMLDREKLDIVMVATLANMRPEITIAALDGGAHVLATKPMAPSLAEAEKMLQAGTRSGRLFMIGYNFRFRDDAQIVNRFIQVGGLGRPLFARAWSHESSVPAWGPHYIKALSSGGSLASTAVHVIDLAVWFLGAPPLLSVTGQVLSRFAALPSLPPELEAIRSSYDTEDLVSGYVRFAGVADGEQGAAMSVEGMWLAPPALNKKGVDIWGTTGYASLEPLRLISWENGDYVDKTELVAPGLADAFQDDSMLRTRQEVHHFIDCVLGRATPLITPTQMRTVQAIVEGLYDKRGDI
ncbi:MAG: Gfo/Idh/MocA family oxidoreductase [Chloroflexi bacterium]|nr:Gfo/Idh/MocA family oxidoreductase [Chloroflexota bacterium]